MGSLVWGFLVIVLFPLLQIPVILYIARHLEIDPETRTTDADSDDSDAARLAQRYWDKPNHHQSLRSERYEMDSSTITCPHCGTENDRAYTYCRNCVARLPTIGVS